jgi:hypothetical protein
MPLNAPQVTPPTLSGLSAEEIPPDAQAMGAKAPPVDPTAVPSSATTISPVAAAGVDLAKCVLAIVSGVIIILMGYLAWMDWRVASDVADSYKQVLNPSRTGSEFYTLDRLEQFVSDLNAARTNPALTISGDAAQRDTDVIKLVGELPSLTNTQKAQLQQCLPLPTDSSRAEKLAQCIAIVGNVRQAALGAAATTTVAQMASAAAEKIQDQRQSLHQFWIQASQLILLNLLLPLLTALFGYIFGTQQATGKTS